MSTRIEVVRGDITTQEVDVIVNAANSGLRGGGGVDGAIHRAAGESALQEACRPLAPCPPGEVRITPGFALPAPWIVHTVGPIWRGGQEAEEQTLRSCYVNCLHAADDLKAESIAFPAISTGVYGYPGDQAASVAVNAVATAGAEVNLVRFVAFSAGAETLLNNALR